MEFPMGNLISAAAQFAGNWGAQKAQTKAAKFGVRWRVEDAKQAGIHPLAALGANISSPNYSSLAGDGVGDALKELFNSPTTIERNRLENERISAETNRLNEEARNLAAARSRTLISNSRNVRGGEADRIVEGVVRPTGVGGDERRERAAGRGGEGARRVPDRYFAGPFGHIERDPRTTSAQDWQDQYGDIVENVAGMGINLPYDILNTYRRRRFRDDVRRYREDTAGEVRGSRWRWRGPRRY